jgi:hypothetical protein
MGTVGDVYQVKLFQDYLGVDVLNVFYYILETQGTGSNLATQLATQFDTDVITEMAEIQVDDLSYTQLEVVNLGDLTEFSATPGSGLATPDGNRVGDPLPAFFVASFRFQRAAVGQRYGYKRLSGIQEQDVVGNSLDSGRQAAFNALAADFALTLDDGLGNTWAPYVAKRPIVLGVNPAGYVSKGCVFDGWATQNTRKS